MSRNNSHPNNKDKKVSLMYLSNINKLVSSFTT